MPPSLVGTWVTSSIAWFPVDAWQFIPRFVDLKFFRPEAGSEIWTSWDDQWEQFSSDPANNEQIVLAKIKHPSPHAILASFVFNDNYTFQAKMDRNLIERFETYDLNGTYDLQPDELIGSYGGEIRFLGDNDVPYFRWKYHLVSNDEMNFITSYRTTAEPDPVTPDDLLQTVAGTMKRSLL